ncbi:hypothetical protein EPUL_005021, partial [Erysiphe pulchra]
MGQQQSVPEDVRIDEHYLPNSTVESNNSKYFAPSQLASKRSIGKRNSAYSSLEEKSFNPPIPKPKPLPDLNKELPKIQCQNQNQKRQSIFRSRIKSLKAQVLTEETDNLRNITHLFSNSDLSCHSESDQKIFENDISTIPSKDYRKSHLRSQKTSNTTENEYFYQNGKYRISVDERPRESASLRYESHVMEKNIKKDSQPINSTEVYRNSFLRYNITAKLVPKSRTEARKSIPSPCKQHRANLLSGVKEDKNGQYQKTNNYQYNVKDSFQPQRTVTPNDLDYRHIGAFKLGTLRITNGVASPAPSIDQGVKYEKRPQSRDTSTLQDPIQYNKPLPMQGPKARPWTVGWNSPLRNNRDYDPATPEILSLSLNSNTEDTSFSRLNVVEERMIPLKPDMEHAQNFEDPFTHGLISPYSLVELVEQSPPPQRTKMKLAVRDSLFDEEPWTPTVLHHPSPNLHNPTPQILGEDREYLSLTKSLTKADSGYRSNISIRSKKSNSEHTPNGDSEFRTSRSNSGAFSFVPSINLKEDQLNQKTSEFSVDSEKLQLFNTLEDGNSVRKDCKSQISEDENALIQKDNETISDKLISFTTLSSSIEPVSTPSLSNSPTQTTKNTTPNSPTSKSSLQIIPSLLFCGTRKESSENLSQGYHQDYSDEEFCQIKKIRDSFSLNLASKALLLQTSNLQPLCNNEVIKDPPSLIENYQNLNKAVKHNSLSLLAPLDLPTEMTQGSLQSINTRVIHYEDVKDIVQKREFGSIENRAVENSNQADTKTYANSSPSADVTPNHRLTFTPENHVEQPLEKFSLKSIDSPLLLDFKETSSHILGDQNIQNSKSNVESSTFLELKRNNSNQFSPNRNRSLSPPIPRRSPLRVPRNTSFILSEESKPQHKITSKIKEISTFTRDKCHNSSEGLDSDEIFSTTSQYPKGSKKNKFHQVAYRLGKYSQIEPRPVIVPTMVANFQAIEQKNIQKDNSSFKSAGNISVGKIFGPENVKESESTWFLRQKKSSQSISTEIPFPKIAKDGLESEESLKSNNSTKLIEHDRPKRNRRSSSALTTEIPRVVSVLKTRKSFEVRALENRTGYSDTSRFHALREGVSRFITSIPGSTTSSNETNTKCDSANEKRQESQRQDWRLRSSNMYSGSKSTESLDRYMNRNLDRKDSSNMSHNNNSNIKQRSSNTSGQNEPDVNLARKKTLSPPRRKVRSHPPQAHITRRSYSMFNQQPNIPNITNFYTFIENTQKENLGLQDTKSTSQLPSDTEGKMPHRKRNASSSEKSERKLDSTSYTSSERLDTKITTDEENPPKISSAFKDNFLSPLSFQNPQNSKNNTLSSKFISCGKLTHEECNTICKKEEQPDKSNEEVLADKWHDDSNSRIESKKSQIDKSQNDSVLNRGRPISRAVETALLSKISDANIALKSNTLKNSLNQENSKIPLINLDKDEILIESHVPSYSDPIKEPLTETTLTNLNSSEEVHDKQRNSYSLSETNPLSTIKNSIDTLPSQKMARNITLSIPVPSQRSTFQKSCLTTDLQQNKKVDHLFLENPLPEISSKENHSNASQLSKSPISKEIKEPTTIGTLPLNRLFEISPISINTRSLLPDTNNFSTPLFNKISPEARFVETKIKESPCENSLFEENQNAPTNTISSLDSLPSQCKELKLRNSKDLWRLSLSPNEGATSRDNISEIECSQVQRLESRGLKKLDNQNLDTVESRHNHQNHLQIHLDSPVRGPNTSILKNFPTIPKSISSYHNPTAFLPTYSYPTPSSRTSMPNINNSGEVIMSPYLYTSPLSSISSEEDRDILVLSAGWRKDAAFTTHSGSTYTQSGLDFNSSIGAIGQK